MTPPLLYRVWVAASAILLPIFGVREQGKLRRAGLPKTRQREKLGHASEPRPEGHLVWVHAASVGESLSVLSLISAMSRQNPALSFLITSGTATSAALVAQRMPPRSRHQFAPLDAPGPMRRFLSHWQPDAAIFVESELWPQMLARTRETGARLALVNARLSARSVERWAKRADLAAFLMQQFALVLTQNKAMAEAVIRLGADPERVTPGINLKSMSPALPASPQTLVELQEKLAGRPVWVAASTHAGEEAEVLAAHLKLRETLPDAHLILAPRHPDRAGEVARRISESGLVFTRRSAGQAPGDAVYLADTLGELGLWYALTHVVFLGGSLRPIGGHNPFEVAQAGAFALSGPHVFNFAETFAEMEMAGAARLIADTDDLAATVLADLTDPEAPNRARRAAQAFTAGQANRLDDIAAQLCDALEVSA